MDAWYLKYRSQKVSELDLESARAALLKILESGKVPRALLFTGPRGTGKTSAARILAKVLNCERNREKKTLSEPCNQCRECLAITGGSAVDVLEIDAASNRGIDDIRELRERVRLAPSSGKYRVYIVDEVHMLTNEAFNALLKTLEEPPAHAVFILCTTDPQKVPETIMSRCTRIVFPQATKEEVVRKLKRVAQMEKLDIAAESLGEIASVAKGSFRDGIKILEQAVSGTSGKKISKADVEEVLGRVKGVEPGKLLGLMARRNAQKALEEVGRAAASGVNVKVYIEEMVDLVRMTMLGKVGVSGAESGLAEIENLSVFELDQLIRLLSRAYAELREAVLLQLPLELAVVEWCGVGGAEGSNSKQSLAFQAKSEQEVRLDEKAEVVPQIDGAGVSFDRVSQQWAEVMQKVKPKNHSVEALLRACRPLSISKGFLNIEVYYKFHKERLETEKCRAIVEETVAEVLGVPLRIKFQLGERAVAREADTAIPADKNDVSGKEVDEEIVKAAAEIFKGTVVE